MLKRLLGAGALAACLIGSAQPAQAKLTSCWMWTPDTVGSASQETCDVTLRTEPSSRTTSGYLRTWVINDLSSRTVLHATLWDDDTAELVFVDPDGTVSAQVEGTWWFDSDGDRRIDMGSGYQLAFTEPSGDYSAGSHYPPAYSSPTEAYQPTRGGGLSSGEFSDRPFRF